MVDVRLGRREVGREPQAKRRAAAEVRRYADEEGARVRAGDGRRVVSKHVVGGLALRVGSGEVRLAGRNLAPAGDSRQERRVGAAAKHPRESAARRVLVLLYLTAAARPV